MKIIPISISHLVDRSDDEVVVYRPSRQNPKRRCLCTKHFHFYDIHYGSIPFSAKYVY